MTIGLFLFKKITTYSRIGEDGISLTGGDAFRGEGRRPRDRGRRLAYSGFSCPHLISPNHNPFKTDSVYTFHEILLVHHLLDYFKIISKYGFTYHQAFKPDCKISVCVLSLSLICTHTAILTFDTASVSGGILSLGFFSLNSLH